MPENLIFSKQILHINDANSAIENGVTYWLSDDGINKPIEYGGILKTTNSEAYIFHTFHCIDNTVWARVYKNETGWSSWRKLTN